MVSVCHMERSRAYRISALQAAGALNRKSREPGMTSRGGRSIQALLVASVSRARAAGLHTLEVARRKGLAPGAAQQIDEILRRGTSR